MIANINEIITMNRNTEHTKLRLKTAVNLLRHSKLSHLFQLLVPFCFGYLNYNSTQLKKTV